MKKIPVDPEAITREWARRHPEFMKPIKEKKVVKMDERTAQVIRDELNAARLYICPQCKKEFAYKAIYKKHLTRCTAGIAQDTIKPAVKEDATKVQPPDMEFIDNRPIDYKAIDDMAAKMAGPPAPEAPNAYAPTTKADGFIQTYGTPAKITPPAPVPPAVSHKVDAVYYLIMAILSTLLLCGLIAAALGIKLLVGL